MTAPEVTAFTTRVYEQMPEAHRVPDVGLDYPLLRYLSLVLDAVDVVDTLAERFSPVDATGRRRTPELVDPLLADEPWLRWLGQLVGATRLDGLTGISLREAVRFAASGYRVGTKAAIADAARSALTGTRYARVFDHSIVTPGDGGRWDVLVVTRTSETPDVDAVLAAIHEKGAKPAGVVLHHRLHEATYAQVQGGTTPDSYAARAAAFPTYTAATDYLPEGA